MGNLDVFLGGIGERGLLLGFQGGVFSAQFGELLFEPLDGFTFGPVNLPALYLDLTIEFLVGAVNRTALNASDETRSQ